VRGRRIQTPRTRFDTSIQAHQAARERSDVADSKDHWETVYQRKAPADVSWYRPHLERSLRFIDTAGLGRDAAIIDVGGGASTLVDDLLARGYENVTVLDLSESAMSRARARLGTRAKSATWLVGDVTTMDLPEHRFEFWHDRALFHFLTDPDRRARYIAAVRRAVKPEGHVLVATFGPSGPDHCSGLSVVRYSAEGIHEQFGTEFRKVGTDEESHQTPWGSEQEFVYCYCRMRG
jgi:ubiquinone/menaquinone biosynthesis C-methylase UbiE